MEKFDLIRNHCLVGRPVVDVEMADAWIDAELAFRGSARGLNCRPRLGGAPAAGKKDDMRK
jgi:hypothetical protein